MIDVDTDICRLLTETGWAGGYLESHLNHKFTFQYDRSILYDKIMKISDAIERKYLYILTILLYFLNYVQSLKY